jgi:type VII secretion-associated serine protease mycosin
MRRTAGTAGLRLLAAVAACLVGSAGLAPAAAAAGQTAPPRTVCADRDPDLPRLTAQEAAAEPWPATALQFRQAWRFSTGNNVTVAVVDSGVDAGHPQLAGAVLPGFDVTSGSVRPGGRTDCAGHGTAVAALVAARPVDGVGFAGVAPDAKVLPVRQTWGLDERGQPVTATPESLVAAMTAAVRSGAQVVNVSVSVLDAGLSDAQRQAFADVVQDASDRDVLVVAATGNRSEYADAERNGVPLVTYPARLAEFYPNVVAVGGVGTDGRTLTPDGDAVTGRFVTLAAPDRAMPSAFVGGGLVVVNGTSFAAPLVSGAAALVRSRFPRLSAAQVRDRLVATADRPSTDLPDPALGYGVVDPVAAVTAVLPAGAAPAAGDRTGPPLRPVADPEAGRRRAAVLGAAGAAGASLLVLVGAVVLRRGRRRGWRPGGVPGPASPQSDRLDRQPAGR